jgi:serine protease
VTGTNTGSGIWFQDGNGHGTHTAGTIGAIGSNSIGVVGVRNNPSVFRFHIGKGLSNEGSGFESDIMQAVQGCVDNGARVVSMSLGGAGDSKTAKEFYKDMYDQGVLLIAAAGNDGNTGAMYPASYKYVMSVAAVDRNETRPDFSQCNINVEIAGPGVDVLSTIPDGRYAIASGTSMACPHVAGVAAEIWARFPDCTNNQIRNVLLRSAKPLGEYGCANTLGSGLVQSKDAFDLLEAEGCEAGGAVDDVLSDGAVGGCEQNPDFVVEDNPYFGQCPSAAPASLLSGFVLGFSTSLLLYFL